MEENEKLANATKGESRPKGGLGISVIARTASIIPSRKATGEGTRPWSSRSGDVKQHNNSQEETMKTKAVAERVAVAFIILAGALVAFLPAQEAQPAK